MIMMVMIAMMIILGIIVNKIMDNVGHFLESQRQGAVHKSFVTFWSHCIGDGDADNHHGDDGEDDVQN